jgi:two-component system sensor histidine kinase/response regulator
VVRVLVAEDSLINARATQRLIERLGHEAVLVSTGEDAVEAAAGAQLILMDCEMPGLDGYGAVRAIREREEATGAHVPIVAMTAHVGPAQRERCLAAGMDDFVAKPLRAGALESVVHRWIAELGAIDDQRFAEMEEDLSADDVREIVSAFLETTPEYVEVCMRAGQTRDGDALRAAAHRLKGGCMAVGAMGLARSAARLEELVLAGALDGRTDAALRDLQRAWRATEHALRARLP